MQSYLSKIRFREDTSLNWQNVNPILASSEPGRETNTGLIKVGDGVTNWNNLNYINSSSTYNVTDVNADGNFYVRQKEDGSQIGQWINIEYILEETLPKTYLDLLKMPFNTELDMNYIIFNGEEQKSVYGIRKNIEIIDIEEPIIILENITSIISYNGYLKNNGIQYIIPGNNLNFTIENNNLTLSLDPETELNECKLELNLIFTK